MVLKCLLRNLVLPSPVLWENIRYNVGVTSYDVSVAMNKTKEQMIYFISFSLVGSFELLHGRHESIVVDKMVKRVPNELILVIIIMFFLHIMCILSISLLVGD